MKYTDKRKDYIRDMRASRPRPMQVPALPSGKAEPEPVQDLVRVRLDPQMRCGSWEVMLREEAIARGKEFEEIPPEQKNAQWWIESTPQSVAREIRAGKAHIYSAGDKTTVVTNPDGSPYEFKTGSKRGQMAELAAMIRTSKHLNLPKDIDVDITH